MVLLCVRNKLYCNDNLNTTNNDNNAMLVFILNFSATITIAIASPINIHL